MTNTLDNNLVRMDFSTAMYNFDVLVSLIPYQKLMVIDGNKLEYDNRWVKSVRRLITGDSKYDIQEPIMSTLNNLVYHQLEKCLDLVPKLMDVLKVTYPDWTEIQQLLSKFIDDNSKQQNNDKIASTISNIAIGPGDSTISNIAMGYETSCHGFNSIAIGNVCTTNFGTSCPIGVQGTVGVEGVVGSVGSVGSVGDIKFFNELPSISDDVDSTFADTKPFDFTFPDYEFPILDYTNWDTKQMNSWTHQTESWEPVKEQDEFDRLSQVETECVYLSEENRDLKDKQYFFEKQVELLKNEIAELRTDFVSQAQSNKFQQTQLKTMILQYHKKQKKNIKNVQTLLENSLVNVYDEIDTLDLKYENEAKKSKMIVDELVFKVDELDDYTLCIDDSLVDAENKLDITADKVQVVLNEVDRISSNCDGIDTEVITLVQEMNWMKKAKGLELKSIKNICDCINGICDDLDTMDVTIADLKQDNHDMFKDVDQLFSDTEIIENILLKLLRESRSKKNVDDN